MPPKPKKVSLIIFVVATLLIVGMVPLILTGWFLSDKSGRELRSAENRYQIQLVQEKARQIEMFGKRYSGVVSGIASAFELSNDPSILSGPQTEQKLGALLRDNPDLAALYVKPANVDSLSAFRSEIVNRDDVELIAANTIPTKKAGAVEVGERQIVASSGESVMTFSTDVIINGSQPAKVLAVASLREIARSTVGFSSVREDELWRGGLPIVFVVDPDGKAVFHPDPSLPASSRSMSNLKIVQDWRESGSQVQSHSYRFLPITRA